MKMDVFKKYLDANFDLELLYSFLLYFTVPRFMKEEEFSEDDAAEAIKLFMDKCLERAQKLNQQDHPKEKIDRTAGSDKDFLRGAGFYEPNTELFLTRIIQRLAVSIEMRHINYSSDEDPEISTKRIKRIIGEWHHLKAVELQTFFEGRRSVQKWGERHT